MPGSMPEGKAFIKDILSRRKINRILDVGPGSGNYYDLLSNCGEYANYPGKPLTDVRWFAVEIFSDYIDTFNLRNKYDQIIISDIYDFEWVDFEKFDVVILGDVLEHMSEERGEEVIYQASKHSDLVVLSLPIVDYPQGESWGNIHEAHVAQYSSEKIKNLLADYDVVAYYEGNIIGAYIFRSI